MRYLRILAVVAVWLHSAASAQVLSNIAGTGVAGFNGDDPLHTAATAQVNVPVGLALDSGGNLFIADSSNHRVRKVTPAGVITTIAGDGNPQGALAAPTAVAVDSAGNVFIADTFNHRVRKVAASNGVVTTIAGTGSQGLGADGVQGTASALTYPRGVAVDSAGNVYVSDTDNHRVRKLDTGGVITTVAGTGGSPGCSNTQLNAPRGLAIAGTGDIFIADANNHRVMRLSGGTMSPFAGSATCTSGGEEGAATSAARFSSPAAVSINNANDVFIADGGNNRIRRVRLGAVASVAGGGSATGCAAATSQQLAGPLGVAAVAGSDAFYLSDTGVDRVRKVAIGAPCAPKLDSASGGSGQTSLNFTAGYDGGSAVTAFNASCTPGPLTGSSTATPILVSGMTNGTQYTCSVTATNANGTSPVSNALQVTPGSPSVSLSSTQVDFGGQSMGTTSAPKTVTLTNTGGTAFTVSGLSAPNAQFTNLTHNCTSVAPAATCTISATFSPAPSVLVPVGGTSLVTTNLSVTSNATGSPHSITLVGTAEKSLVTHYYRSILRRDPDSGGKSFWTGEATRVAGLPANVNEAWFAMAATFYNSAEYTAFGRNQTEFVTDLYNTFFNRPPDSGGLNFWIGEMAAGMPREVVLVSFMFSAEFGNFTTNIFGTSSIRAERDMVMDFFRGLLARLPDDGGFNFFVNKLKAAQCSGAAAVTSEADSISSSFITSAEYTARNRTTAQYVGDLYNAFLRRGGDTGGVNFWINQINSGSMTREQVRVSFRGSAEFGARVQAVINAGCQGS